MNQHLADLLKGLDSGLADIREKLVEESWYGRPLGDGGPAYNIMTTETENDGIKPDPQQQDWVSRVSQEPARLDPSDLRGGVDLER